MTSKPTLEGLRQQIKDQVGYVDVKSHSHNIITLDLQAIQEEFGTEEANRAIRDFRLDKKGWHEQPCETGGTD